MGLLLVIGNINYTISTIIYHHRLSTISSSPAVSAAPPLRSDPQLRLRHADADVHELLRHGGAVGGVHVPR